MIEEVPPPYSEIDIIAENRAIVDNVLNHVREVERDRQNYLGMYDGPLATKEEALATRIMEMKQGVTPKEIIDFYIEYHRDCETFANAIGDNIGDDIETNNTNIMNWVNCDKTQKDLKKFMRKRHKIEDWIGHIGCSYLSYEKTEFVNINGGKFRVTLEKNDDYPLFMIVFRLAGRNKTKMILD